MIEFSDFEKVEMRIGTILQAERHTKARHPAYILQIDFGDYGIKTSTAQLTEQYAPEDLPGKQVMAVMNFPSKRVADIKSEVLVLAAVNDIDGTVLMQPDFQVQNGSRIF